MTTIVIVGIAVLSGLYVCKGHSTHHLRLLHGTLSQRSPLCEYSAKHGAGAQATGFSLQREGDDTITLAIIAH
jgi:hypothetical protein